MTDVTSYSINVESVLHFLQLLTNICISQDSWLKPKRTFLKNFEMKSEIMFELSKKQFSFAYNKC